MKVFIDANIYLDFYRSTNDAIKVFDELINNASSLILTDQIIDEFYRNREVVLRLIKSKFKTDTQIEHFSSSFLQNLKEFGELNDIKNLYNSKRKEIEKNINDTIDDPTKDIVVQHFEKLIGTDGIVILKTSDDIIKNAQIRKLVGNPPVSDKYSIGDEINWELLLTGSKDDIVMVGRDSTFKDNINFLKLDYHRNTGRTITLLTDKITSAIEQIGKQITPEVKEIEDKQLKELKTFGHHWTVTSVQGNIANVTDGRVGGYTVIDIKGVDPSFICGNCGSNGPWNGIRCLTCGVMSDD